jgi:hypothetical protein
VAETGDVEVMGVFLQALANACLNLHLLAGDEAVEACDVEPMRWYPASRFEELFQRVVGRFPTPEPVRERIGIEMMRLWFDPGPGRGIITSAADFLRYQTGSEGYHSLARGPAEQKGAFTLIELDEARGLAVVRSTTPFDRAMERGVLLGGTRLTGDATFARVDNDSDRSTFRVEYH